VDFYSGIILRAIGIPTNMFTVIFAIGRLPGWIAQRKEQHDDPTTKIFLPPAANLHRSPKQITFPSRNAELPFLHRPRRNGAGVRPEALRETPHRLAFAAASATP
jgi:hypothetical protein